MPFGSVLRELRVQHKMTQSKLADAIGVSESTIGMYERGHREPAFEVLEAIADYFNVDMDYLTGRSSVQRRFAFEYPGSIPSGFEPMPKMNIAPLLGDIACGEPILALENIEGYVDIPEHVHADFALRCKGDSMINARIFDGDVVYIRQQSTVNDGEIAAVLIGDEATLKRVRLFEDHISLEPENPQYRPIVKWGQEMETVRILGKAVAFTSAVR